MKMENKFENYGDEQLFEEIFRATGRSTRLADNYIQDFFTQPMGTKIYIHDHHGTREADNYLLGVVLKRIENEHRTKYRKGADSKGFYIVRDEPIRREEVLAEIERRQLTV